MIRLTNKDTQRVTVWIEKTADAVVRGESEQQRDDERSRLTGGMDALRAIIDPDQFDDLDERATSLLGEQER